MSFIRIKNGLITEKKLGGTQISAQNDLIMGLEFNGAAF
jgi:hypothetical protein